MTIYKGKQHKKHKENENTHKIVYK